MDVVIIGGSLSGLMYGVVLKDLGHHVRIFEKSQEALLGQAGAGLQVSKDIETFMNQYECDLEPYYIANPKALIVDGEGKLINTLKPGVRATSWDTLYHRLRARFDGLKTEFYRPILKGQSGTGTYWHGHIVDSFSLVADKIKIEYRTPDGAETREADLVIVADGSGSKMRRILQAETKPEYLGYVALRGTVSPEMSENTMRNGLDRHCQIHQSFFLSYTIPGEYGKVEPPERVRNWIWFRKLSANSTDFRDLMTDVRGKFHTYSLPRGGMRGEVWERLQRLAQQLLDPHCADHLRKSGQPFVQAVTKLSYSRALYHNGKALLVGDAFATLRPLSAQGTDQAAKGALALKRVFQGEMTLEDWETIVLKNAEVAHRFGLLREKGAQLSD